MAVAYKDWGNLFNTTLALPKERATCNAFLELKQWADFCRVSGYWCLWKPVLLSYALLACYIDLSPVVAAWYWQVVLL